MEMNWVLLYPLTQTDSRYAQEFGEMVEHVQSQDYDDRLDVLWSHRWDEDTQEWGERLSLLFLTWRKDPYPPSVCHTLQWACDLLDICPDDYPSITIPMAAAVLADLRHNNPYHNNHHFREVIILITLLIDTHIHFDEVAVNLTKEDMLMLLTAAAIHDFGHNGHGNFVEGVHFPSRMEKKSFLKTKDFLATAGASRDYRDKVELMLICTDVSRGQSGRSPSGHCRDIFLAHEHDNVSIVNAPSDFKQLLQNRKLSLMAALLCEADIGISAGLSYEFAKEMTRLVAEESSVLTPSPTTLHGFMEVVCHGGFMTPAANSLMGDNFKTIIKCAEQDMENNILYA
jgi:hypothetical protein